jgi:hypothetical protein
MIKIKTKKKIGYRVSDIGPGGKEYNVEEFKWNPKNRKPLNYNKMSCPDLALMWKVSKDQNDKKSMSKIAKIYVKKKCIK